MEEKQEMTLADLPDHLRDLVEAVDCGHSSPCWIWKGERNRNNYGTFRKTIAKGKRKRFMSHIVIYKHFNGEYEVGLYLDHHCVNPPCCNPAHLEPVTPLVNTQRGSSCMFKKADEYEMSDLQY